MHGEMPGFFPGRPGGEHDEPLLDMILERRPIPPGAPPEIHGLARMLAAVAGPAEPGDLDGQAAAHAAFTRLVSPPSASPAALRSARRSLSERPARGRLPLAALAVAAAGLGSTAAAYADVLPSPIQHFAHVTFGAPAPPQDASPGPLTITGSLAPRHTTPGTSGSARRHPAASSGPAGGKTRSGPPGSHGLKGYGAAPGLASCPATPDQDRGRALGHSQNPVVPSPAPNQARPTSAQGQAGSGPGQNTASPGSVPSGWPTMPSPTTACPNGAVPTKGAHASG